jgi:hypothetical protein
MRRWLPAVVAVAAAAVIAVLAHGAFAVESDLGAGRTAELLPERIASGLLGTGDDLAFRHSLRLAAGPAQSIADLLRSRSRAAAILARLADHGNSRAANLLGLIELDNAELDRQGARGYRAAARAAFAQAVRIDPANEDAKYNLELLLSLERRQGKQRAGKSQHQRAHHSQAGNRPPGAGY